MSKKEPPWPRIKRLWVFTNQKITVYAVETSRGHEGVVNVLGKEFKGILVTDCFLAYDHHALKDWLKQKCLSHLLKDLKEMKESKSGRALHFARQVTMVLQAALALKAEKNRLDPLTFHQQAQKLESRLDLLIAPRRRLSDRDNARFAKRLRKHRPHLLRFLYVDDLVTDSGWRSRGLGKVVLDWLRAEARRQRTRAGVERAARRMRARATRTASRPA